LALAGLLESAEPELDFSAGFESVLVLEPLSESEPELELELLSEEEPPLSEPELDPDEDSAFEAFCSRWRLRVP
jgi:hypothetical protein